MKKIQKNKRTILNYTFLLLLVIGVMSSGVSIKRVFVKEDIPFLSSVETQVYVWNHTWGGGGGDEGSSVALDSSNNLYFVGGYGSTMILVKYNNSGSEQWDRVWGGSGGDAGYGVALDSSDNIYVSGATTSFGAGSQDMFLVKYDNVGVQQWNKTWGGGDIDGATGVAVDSLGNVYIAGYSASYTAGLYDLVLIKYDSSGILQWNDLWGGFGYNLGYDVVVDSANNVYVGGVSRFGAGGNDVVLVKYNNAGVQQWNRTWGGANYDECLGVTIDSSDNLYVVGYTQSFGAGSQDICLVKYSSMGVQQWNRTWGGFSLDEGYAVYVDSSDDVYLTGRTLNFGAGNYDAVLVKYDSAGTQQWNETWGDTGSDLGNDIILDDDDNIFLGGTTNSIGAGDYDMVLIKYLLDTDDPVLTINNPSQGDTYGDNAPNFDISITEPNLASIWYTIDGGVTNYSISIPQLSGTINQEAWEAVPYGNITISFSAVDLLGNSGNNEVIVEKTVSTSLEVSGYPILLLIGMIGVVGLIITHNLKKK